MSTVREPAFAGMFYPADPARLRDEVNSLLDAVDDTAPAPKAMIVPHAGYVYSGPVAASAYARLRQARATIDRVLLLGPAHRVFCRGLAASSAERFRTPLGAVALDRAAIDRVLPLPQVHTMDPAHGEEHSLEVHLPFLQMTLDSFSLVPLVVGDATAEQVGEVLEALWGGAETLVVVSSDLSHFHDYQTARRMDARTSAAIEALRPQDIHHEQACGRNPVNGLLHLARKLGLRADTIDVRNSGDTAGPRDRVVGYGAYVFQ